MKRMPLAKEVEKTPGTELEEFKKFLGPLATEYTASQLRQLRQEMQAMTELLLDLYASKQHASDFDRLRQQS